MGVTHYHAGLLPDEKVEEVVHLKKKYGNVAMIGDGVNDAPVLANANVGRGHGHGPFVGRDTECNTVEAGTMSCSVWVRFHG